MSLDYDSWIDNSSENGENSLIAESQIDANSTVTELLKRA